MNNKRVCPELSEEGVLCLQVLPCCKNQTFSIDYRFGDSATCGLTENNPVQPRSREGARRYNRPDLGGILKFVEGFIAELRQQTGQTSAEQQRGREV